MTPYGRHSPLVIGGDPLEALLRKRERRRRAVFLLVAAAFFIAIWCVVYVPPLGRKWGWW